MRGLPVDRPTQSAVTAVGAVTLLVVPVAPAGCSPRNELSACQPFNRVLVPRHDVMCSEIMNGRCVKEPSRNSTFLTDAVQSTERSSRTEFLWTPSVKRSEFHEVGSLSKSTGEWHMSDNEVRTTRVACVPTRRSLRKALGGWLALMLSGSVIVIDAQPALAAAGDVFAAGRSYCIDSYSGHPNYFGSSPARHQLSWGPWSAALCPRGGNRATGDYSRVRIWMGKLRHLDKFCRHRTAAPRAP